VAHALVAVHEWVIANEAEAESCRFDFHASVKFLATKCSLRLFDGRLQSATVT
jgi:hypothetical protein